MATKKKKRFSVRQGIQPEPKPRLDEAPEALRYFLLKYLETFHGGRPGDVLADFLHRPDLSTRPNFFEVYDPSVIYNYLQRFDWWQVYDLAEEIYSRVENSYTREEFLRQLNEVMAEQNIPWRMDYDGEIAYKGSEAFESAAHAAIFELTKAHRNTAKDEIHKALEDLSKRPHPDLTGAVHHAMNALECVAKDVCGKDKGTLGDIVKRHPDKFPPPVGDAVSKLYGFASEKGRHITEGGEPDLKEVELIVGTAATVATYLSRSAASPVSKKRERVTGGKRA